MELFESLFQLFLSQDSGFGLSAGLAIISLSLCINLVLLPAFILIDRSRDQNQPKMDRMQAEISRIKSAYSGRKRFFQIKAVHRRFGYTPWAILKSSLGIFIQMPVFLAVYHYLSDNPHFDGKAFGVIADLSQPDRLLFGYNALPLLMTIANLLPLLIVRKDTLQGQAKQIVLIAGLFLVLLYDRSAALLVYFTASNVLNTLRIAATNWRHLSFRPIASHLKALHAWMHENSAVLKTTCFFLFVYAAIIHFWATEAGSLSWKASYGVLFILAAAQIPMQALQPNRNWKSLILVSIALILVGMYYILTDQWRLNVILISALMTLVAIKSDSVKEAIRPQLLEKPDWLLLGLLLPLADHLSLNWGFFTPKTGLMFLGSFAVVTYVGLIAAKILVRWGRARQWAVPMVFGALLTILWLPKITHALSLRSDNNFPVNILLVTVLLPCVYLLLKRVPALVLAALMLAPIPFLVHTNNQVRVEEEDIEDFGANASIKPVESDMVTKPDIYMLIYDSYQSHSKYFANYGINNQQQEKFLQNLGFEFYEGIYTVYPASYGAMSRVLSLNSGDIRFLSNYMLGQGYENYFVTPSNFQKQDFIFPGTQQYPDTGLADMHGLSQFLSGLRYGEFKFDIKPIIRSASRKDLLKKKKEFLSAQPSKPRFFYMHSLYPGHTQNSGSCLKDELPRHKKKLKEANREMRADLENIMRHDREAVIIIVGDHGPYLTGDCHKLKHIKKAKITRRDIDDRFATFMAIKWPDALKAETHRMRILQDVFFEVLSRTNRDDSVYEHQYAIDSYWKYSNCSQMFKDNVIQCGVAKGQKLVNFIPYSAQ